MGMEEAMKYITIQIPVPLASKLVDAIQVGAEGLDESDYKQLMKLSQQISEDLDNNEQFERSR
jgi:Holliday junction resolvasome RuvABC ATP-dependent DNA helicase subunit